MADHIKGPAEKALPLLTELSLAQQQQVVAGIRYHRDIDRSVDRSPDVLALRQMFLPEYRRYAGIVLDMAWDFHLARRWPEYHPEPLPDFANRQYELFLRYYEQQPASMQRMVFYMSRDDWLSAYRNFSGIESALKGMSGRIKRENCLAEAATEILRLEETLDGAFDRIMEQLRQVPFQRLQTPA